jgi:hypothetical protein
LGGAGGVAQFMEIPRVLAMVQNHLLIEIVEFVKHAV